MLCSYEPDAVMCNPERVRQLSEMLRYLVSFPFGLIGKLLYARYEEGSFWELSEEDAPLQAPSEAPPRSRTN